VPRLIRVHADVWSGARALSAWPLHAPGGGGRPCSRARGGFRGLTGQTGRAC